MSMMPVTEQGPTGQRRTHRPGRGARIAGVALIVAGLLAVIGCVIGTTAVVGGSVMDSITEPSYPTPLDRTMTLSPGQYLVYERVGTRSGAGPTTFTQVDGPVITPSDVRVTGPDGQVLAGTEVGAVARNLYRGQAIYLGVVRFDAPVQGSYRVQIDSAASTQVVIAQDLLSNLSRFAGWGLGMVAGGMVLLLGIVLLVVGFVVGRPRSPLPAGGAAHPAAYPPAPGYPAPAGPTPVAYPPAPGPTPPAGWYPDPDRPGGQRYWDGMRWTDHKH